MKITLGHSPDPDDAFMFYGIASGEVTEDGLEFEQVLEDIETLNRRALEESLDVTAVSIHAYAYLSDRYALLLTGRASAMATGRSSCPAARSRPPSWPARRSPCPES
jgi:1,4-dihydroxy-6-naphthoate synthase